MCERVWLSFDILLPIYFWIIIIHFSYRGGRQQQNIGHLVLLSHPPISQACIISPPSGRWHHDFFYDFFFPLKKTRNELPHPRPTVKTHTHTHTAHNHNERRKKMKRDVVERAIRGQNFFTHSRKSRKILRKEGRDSFSFFFFFCELCASIPVLSTQKKKFRFPPPDFSCFFSPLFCTRTTVNCIIQTVKINLKRRTETLFEKKSWKTFFKFPFCKTKKKKGNWRENISCVCVCVSVCVYDFVTLPSPSSSFTFICVSSLEKKNNNFFFLGRLVLLNINIILTYTHTHTHPFSRRKIVHVMSSSSFLFVCSPLHCVPFCATPKPKTSSFFFFFFKWKKKKTKKKKIN